MTRVKTADIEPVSRIHTSVAFTDSRQLSVKLHLNDAGPGKTEVEMLVTGLIHSRSLGGTSRQAMREHEFFQLYYAALQQVLDEPRVGTPVEKN